MNSDSLLQFSLIATGILVGVILTSAIWLPRFGFANTVPGGTKEGAKEALTLLSGWTVWMAGIQTATIAALGLLADDGALTLKLNEFQAKLAILVALFNAVALFFSAWLLTSLSSLMLRVYRDNLPHYDFYNLPLYAFMETKPWMKKTFTVAHFAFWNHWLWGIGILLFGALSISVVVRHP